MIKAGVQTIIDANKNELAVLEGNLVSSAGGVTPRTILISSPRRREGRSTTTVAIAHTLSSRLSGRVLLIDLCLANPTLDSLFSGLPEGPSLTDLMDDPEAIDRIAAVPGTDLDILPLGDVKQAGSLLLNSGALIDLLDRLKERYLFVVADGDPILTASSAAVIARDFDGTLLVAACEETKWDLLTDARTRIEGTGATVIGVTLAKRRYYLPKFLYRWL